MTKYTTVNVTRIAEELSYAKMDLQEYQDELKEHDREAKAQLVTRKEILRDIERAKRVVAKLSKGNR